MAAISKTVTISGTNINGNTVELEIPAQSIKRTASNNVNSFAIPNTDPSSLSDARDVKALNMNRISLEIQTEAKISDEYADKNHNGSGSRPDLSNKEDWIQEAWKLYVANEILDFKATNTDTYAATSEYSGYMHNLDWQEKAGNNSTVYKVTIELVDEVPMTS